MELPALMPQVEREWPDWVVDAAFTDSLRWRASTEEFGADRETLFDLWKQHNRHDGPEGELDELIRFAMIPGHPFAMEKLIHPNLLSQESPGARDAIWSIHLVPLWFAEHSNLRQLVAWARDANLYGVQTEVALPAARLLAWMGATSQNELRQAAMQGLTRLLVACPEAFESFLPDFLEVNDAYILEGVLLAVLGEYSMALSRKWPPMPPCEFMKASFLRAIPAGVTLPYVITPDALSKQLRKMVGSMGLIWQWSCHPIRARCPSPVSRINRDSKLSTHHEAMAG